MKGQYRAASDFNLAIFSVLWGLAIFRTLHVTNSLWGLELAYVLIIIVWCISLEPVSISILISVSTSISIVPGLTATHAYDMSHPFLFLRECLGPIIGGALVYRMGFPSMAAVRLIRIRITSCDIPLPHFL